MTGLSSYKKTASRLFLTCGTITAVAGLNPVMINPASAVTTLGNVEATILNGMVPTLSPIEELNFGDIISTGAGNITIDTAGAPTLDPALSLTPGSPHQQGVIRIVGTPGALVEINIVPGAYTVTNGVVTMPVSAFDIGNGPNNDDTVTMSGGGTFDVNVGATLAVGAGQQTGNYTGTFTLNADYQ